MYPPQPADFEIIDAHTHPFLPGSSDCIGHYGSPETMEEFDREMLRVGISRYSGSPIVKRKLRHFEEVVQLNEDVLKIRDAFPGYIPAIQVHGAFPQESCEVLHRMYRQEGIRYIGELVPYIMGTGAFDFPGMLTILEEAGKLGMTVNFHGGTPEEAETVLKHAPGLNVILAHPGEPAEAKKRFDLLNTSPRLFMDLSGTGIFRWNMLRYAINHCGAEKFIFGSDMPTCSPGMLLHGVLSENLTNEEFQLVLAGNFKRLLGL